MIFVIMGKSASGKDAIYKRIFKSERLALEKIVPYTTRPLRHGEEEGKQYHFVSEEKMNRLAAEGRVIEHRQYDTVNGIWHYFTVDDTADACDKDKKYLMIGTLEVYVALKDYYGEENVIPLYISTDGFNRLTRALKREKKQETPNYEELCRRFLADEADFSQENLAAAGIDRIIDNDDDIDECVDRVIAIIDSY